MTKSQTALVAGGTGGLGEGIVKVLLEAGWTVYVPILETAGGEKLKAFTAAVAGDRLHCVKTDLSIPAEVAGLKAAIYKSGLALDLVVVSVGGSYYGKSLHKIELPEWNKLLTENLATHFNLQHEFMDYFHAQNRGTYVTMIGPEADFVDMEIGLLSVFAASQKMISRVAAIEAAGSGVRVYSITSKTPLATRERSEQKVNDWIQPIDVGLYIKSLYEGLVAGKAETMHVLESRGSLRKLLNLPKDA